MSQTRKSLQLAAQLRARLEGITDSHTRTLTGHWARAWDDVAGDLESALNDVLASARDGRVSRAQMQRAARLQKSLDAITAKLTELSAESGITITGDLAAVTGETAAVQAAITAAQLPAGQLAASFDLVSPDAIDAIVKRSAKRITSQLRPLSREATAAAKRELIRAVAVGDNPRVTASRMVNGTQGAFNGGLSRALTISRTEILDAHRAAAAKQDQANADTVTGWIWLASLSKRSCSACWGMNGSVHALSDPGPEGHQNCRCTRQPQTKTWRELGFDIDEPPSLMPDKEERFNALSQADQKAILGPSRYDAWARGDYPMDKWAVRQDNPGWRPSYVISPAPTARTR